MRKKQYDKAEQYMEEILSGIEQIGDFRNAPLYEHMDFTEIREEFLAELKEDLLKCFRDEGDYVFLKNDKRWPELVK